MKRAIVAPVVLALVGVAGWYGWRHWPDALAERWLGYVEGEAIYIAPPVGGTLAARAVDRGARVFAGQPLFTLNPVMTDAETARLEAQLAAARAQAETLGNARQRLPEIRVSEARQAAARAEIERARKEYERFSRLAARGFATKAQVDATRAAYRVAQASLEQAQAEEASGRLTVGRADEMRGAQANIAAIEATIKGQRQRRREIAPVSPANGVVEQTYYNNGEWVGANSPVVSIIADDKRKLRFFVPEGRIAGLSVGQAIRFICDGCAGERRATIRYIAPRAEFTPPVIYSERARAKLVFLVEAQLPAEAKPLPLGLPVDVVPVAQ